MGPVEKMNFAKWLLARTARTLKITGRWDWIEKYRSMIIREKFLSVIATIVGGLVCFIFVGAFCIIFIDETQKQLARDILLTTMYAIPAFYIYNWIAALYEIYDAERIATWDRLKEPE